ncbi:MAG: outer membrane beta-barrel protein [Bacteroidetes bacterium]|nr:outer membrane beta-barrel protein [Bacteroidota bacterium]
MKKNTYAFILLLFFSNRITSQIAENFEKSGEWRFGLQWSEQLNNSTFNGGMSNAPAVFSQNPFASTSFGFTFRYDHNKHWAFIAGLNFKSIGFNYSIAENYSFLNFDPSKRYTKINISMLVTEVPFLVLYKFNPNCKNWKWFVGAGIVNVYYGKNNFSKTLYTQNEMPYINASISSNTGSNVNLHFMFGKEKQFKKGSIFSAALFFNAGIGTIATSNVNYTVNNQHYSHSFINNGNCAGLKLFYSWRPFKRISK